jgi:mannose-6-phosphate isomerase-like protein (cupin superfamily)
MVKTFAVLVGAGALLVSCSPEATPVPGAPTAAPPVVAAPPAPIEARPAVAGSVTASLLAPPVMAKLVDVTATGTTIPMGSRCDVLYVAVAKGNVSASGQSLAPGDVLMASNFAGPGALDLKGSGLVVTVTSLHDCPSPSTASSGPLAIRVARAGDAKDLAWAGGTMHAHLDLEKEISPDVYVGRIEGTAPVAEHDHGPSWEVLCAIEASGTFTLDGIPRHIAGPAIIAVPPGRKHSWQPDPGTKLVAIQVYAPPGPEQRFKTLAAAHGP